MFYTDLASPRAGIYIARECHKRGIPVVYNLQNPPSLDQGVTENVIEEMLGYTNLFITGKATICVTTGIENPTLAVKKFVGTHELSDGYICSREVTEPTGMRRKIIIAVFVKSKALIRPEQEMHTLLVS